MIGRIAFLLTISLSSSVTADEPASFYNAPYEVVTDDPSCNGPYERLVRIKLKAADLLLESAMAEQCYLSLRKGTEIVRSPINCETENHSEVDNSGEQVNKFDLQAELNICQSIWDQKIELVNGEIQGAYSGNSFTSELNNLQAVKTFPLSSVLSDNIQTTATLQLILICPRSQIQNEKYSPQILLGGAGFQLFEHDLDSCTEEACHNRLDATFDPPAIHLRLHCGASEQ